MNAIAIPLQILIILAAAGLGIFILFHVLKGLGFVLGATFHGVRRADPTPQRCQQPDHEAGAAEACVAPEFRVPRGLPAPEGQARTKRTRRSAVRSTTSSGRQAKLSPSMVKPQPMTSRAVSTLRLT